MAPALGGWTPGAETAGLAPGGARRRARPGQLPETLRYAPDGSLPVGALCAEVHLTRSGVTRLIDRMEAAGTVERMAAPADRRTVRAAITEHGRDELRNAWPVHRRGIEQHSTANLTRAEAETLRDLLRRVVPEPG